MFSLNYFSPVLWFYIHAMEVEMALSLDCQFIWLFVSFWSLHVLWLVLKHNLISLWASPSVSVSVFPSPLPLTSILLALFSLLPGLFTFLQLAVRQKSPVFQRPQFRNKVYVAGPGISSQGGIGLLLLQSLNQLAACLWSQFAGCIEFYFSGLWLPRSKSLSSFGKEIFSASSFHFSASCGCCSLWISSGSLLNVEDHHHTLHHRDKIHQSCLFVGRCLTGSKFNL